MRQPTDRTDKVKRENSERAGRAKAGNLPLMLGPLLLTRQVLEQEATHVINAAKKVAEGSKLLAQRRFGRYFSNTEHRTTKKPPASGIMAAGCPVAA